MNKLFSIVIPTLNRCDYLKHTLELIIPQVEAHIDDVELVICCNSSTDGTDSYVKELLAERPYIKYKYFEEYVEVGQSLIRSVGEASGEYCVLWGDDDIPFPNFVETILDIIFKHPNVGIIHCNRLIGKDSVYGVNSLRVNENKIEEQSGYSLSLSELINRFTISLGFISSVIFRTEDFLNAKKFYNKEHYGYEHLAIMLNGAKGKKCYYYGFPLEIQRVPYNRDFSDKWPLYCFAGTPNMMRDFDAAGLTQGSLETWEKRFNKRLMPFIWNMLYTTLDRPFNKKHIKELIKYQHSFFRRMLTYIIVYGMPKSLFLLLRKKDY